MNLLAASPEQLPRGESRSRSQVREEGTVANVTHVGRVVIPVADQDEAIEFYTTVLGFSTVSDVSYGEGARWVEVSPPGGGTAIALAAAHGEYQPGRITGISLASSDARADHAELQAKGVDVDAELWGGDGTVPLGFVFRDNSKNQLMIVESQ